MTAATEAPAAGFTAIDKGLLAANGIFFAFIAYYASIKNVNWDEFFFLSHVHSVARGEAVPPLQTFYVRLFGWLPGLGGDEIFQIMVARGLFVLLLGLSAYFIYRIAAHFFSRTAALFATAIGLSVTNVINHGPSFRFDTLTLVCVVFALFALLKKDMRWWAAAAFSFALALLVTVKAVFFLPAMVAFAVIAGNEERWARPVVMRGLAFAVILAVTYLGLFLLHLLGLGLGPVSGSAEAVQILAESGGKTLGGGVLVPRLPSLLRTLVENPAQWLIMLTGVLSAVVALWRRDRGWRAVAILALALPLFTPLVYRNAFAYFYVMILPPAAIASGYFVETFRARAERPGGGSARALLFAPLAVALALNAGYYAGRLNDQRIAQRETVELVHALFPAPVPYIDRNAMISSFRKVGFFMSTWGVENYRAGGRPVMRELLEEEAPVFLLANSVLLDLDRGGGAGLLEERYLLLAEDLRTLQENYVHFWGILYLAGKRFEFTGGGPRAFEILLPGPYTLEGEGAVTLDGALLTPGSVIDLTKGRHAIAAAGETIAATLVYGEGPRRPAAESSAQPIYTGL